MLSLAIATTEGDTIGGMIGIHVRILVLGDNEVGKSGVDSPLYGRNEVNTNRPSHMNLNRYINLLCTAAGISDILLVCMF